MLRSKYSTPTIVALTIETIPHTSLHERRLRRQSTNSSTSSRNTLVSSSPTTIADKPPVLASIPPRKVSMSSSAKPFPLRVEIPSRSLLLPPLQQNQQQHQQLNQYQHQQKHQFKNTALDASDGISHKTNTSPKNEVQMHGTASREHTNLYPVPQLQINTSLARYSSLHEQMPSPASITSNGHTRRPARVQVDRQQRDLIIGIRPATTPRSAKKFPRPLNSPSALQPSTTVWENPSGECGDVVRRYHMPKKQQAQQQSVNGLLKDRSNPEPHGGSKSSQTRFYISSSSSSTSISDTNTQERQGEPSSFGIKGVVTLKRFVPRIVTVERINGTYLVQPLTSA